MNPDYRKFSAIDFFEDPFFRKWVYENNTEDSVFWSSFLVENADKARVVEEAREALFIVRDLKNRQVTVQMSNKADSIKRNIEKAIHYPLLVASSVESNIPAVNTPPLTLFFSRRALVIAASLAITAVAFMFVVLPHFTYEGLVADGQTVVQTNPKGKRSLLTLPDGTQVWLNAESQLIYMNNFAKQDSREVFLVGEAFFDVVKDESKPFVVNTSSIAIKVLGTRFNVQSYEKERTISTTLVEGEVSLRVINSDDHTSTGEATSLAASQRAVFIKESKKLVLENNVQAEEYSNWRSGKLYFDDKPIMEVLAMIERWYNVNIHLDNPALEHCTFSAKMDNKTLTEVLELFSASASDQLIFSIEGKDVFIRGRLCQ